MTISQKVRIAADQANYEKIGSFYNWKLISVTVVMKFGLNILPSSSAAAALISSPCLDLNDEAIIFDK